LVCSLLLLYLITVGNAIYVWAYNQMFNEAPNKKHLNKAAKLQNNQIHDANFSTYTNHTSKRYFVPSDGTFKLNPDGSKKVQNIILEIKDPELKGVEYWNYIRKNSRKNTRITKEESEKINKWTGMKSKLEKFDIRKLNSNSKIAIFALYDITRELKIESAVKPVLAYQYLKKRHETVSIGQKSFSDTLCAKTNKKYFQKTPEGLYYLTEEAEKIAQDWISET
ncbi:hypothetical protein, partial [Crocosphaera sp. Alani8]|uniref:hypothetical protein n=1 Tax=Crocosphaera sp. Alani8 TaxID=3038952 RepID=UPI00313E4B82